MEGRKEKKQNVVFIALSRNFPLLPLARIAIKLRKLAVILCEQGSFKSISEMNPASLKLLATGFGAWSHQTLVASLVLSHSQYSMGRQLVKHIL